MKKVKIFAIILTATLILVPAVVLATRPQVTPYKGAPVVVQAPIAVQLNADVIFDKVNAERTQRGLKLLIRDARLDAVAQGRANDMVARNYFAHRDPVTNENMVKAQPYCSYASENIVDDINETSDGNISAVYSWMQSKPHREAILDADYDLSGIAIAGTKVVQTFCKQ